MEGRRRGWVVLVVAVVIAVAVALGWSALRGDTSPGGADQAATTASADPVLVVGEADRGEPVALSGSTIQGSQMSVADLVGDVVVVNVWGSWCAPCREEAPVLAAASRDYAARGVSFVGVNVRDNRAAALAFEERYGITYPSIEDPDGRAVLALSGYVPARAVPVTVLLDREGRVAARVLGVVSDDILRGLTDDLLAESDGTPTSASTAVRE